MSDASGSTFSVSSTIRRRQSIDSLPGVEAFLRRRGSTSHIFGPSSLKDLEQYVNKRRQSTTGLIELEKNADIIRESSSLSLGKTQYSSGPLWEQDVARGKEDAPAPLQGQGRRGRRKSNLLDQKTLYSITKENIASRDMVFREKPKVVEDASPNNNIEQKMEREYILKARLRDNTQNKFENAIMKHFYKAPAPKAHPGYGMPRPETREENPFKLMMADLQRDPSIVKINSYPSLSNPKKCENSGDFCEVLGPAACSTCIETTNRYIADELQRIMFPKIDMTRTRLVKPKLSRVMRHGHLVQVRKKKMSALEYPDEFLTPLRRQETQLNRISKTGMSLRRPKRSSQTRKTKSQGALSVINEDFSSVKPVKV